MPVLLATDLRNWPAGDFNTYFYYIGNHVGHTSVFSCICYSNVASPRVQSNLHYYLFIYPLNRVRDLIYSNKYCQLCYRKSLSSLCLLAKASSGSSFQCFRSWANLLHLGSAVSIAWSIKSTFFAVPLYRVLLFTFQMADIVNIRSFHMKLALGMGGTKSRIFFNI